MTNATKTEQLTKIQAELAKMKIGMCGVKFECLVWRVSAEAFAVGLRSVDMEETFDIESAASLVYDLPRCLSGRKWLATV